MEVSVFVCSICGGTSQKICVYCTKDACDNHLCERCAKCSDCCTCDIRLGDSTTASHRNGHAKEALNGKVSSDISNGPIGGDRP
jgi:hypothetical protein